MNLLSLAVSCKTSRESMTRDEHSDNTSSPATAVRYFIIPFLGRSQIFSQSLSGVSQILLELPTPRPIRSFSHGDHFVAVVNPHRER